MQSKEQKAAECRLTPDSSTTSAGVAAEKYAHPRTSTIYVSELVVTAFLAGWHERDKEVAEADKSGYARGLRELEAFKQSLLWRDKKKVGK